MTTLPADLLLRAATGAGPRPASGLDVRCAHCALPVPQAFIREGRERQFCCAACETARGAIEACGLDRYYEYVGRDPAAAGAPARSSGASYEEFDDPAFLATYAQGLAGGASSIRLVVEGLHCAACVWLLERVPQVVKSAVQTRVDYARGLLTITWRPEAGPLSEIARFVDRLGYRLFPVRERAAQEARLREDRAMIVRIAVAGALMGNTMLIAFGLYGGSFTGMEERYTLLFRAVSAVMGLVSLAWPGAVFFRGAAASLRVRSLHMDVPIALALAVGMIHGLVNTARGTGEVYFDTLTTLVFLLLIGRWVQHRQQRRAADAVELLYALSPSAATLVEESGTRRVSAESLASGQIVEVGVGESVPVDGSVVAGQSMLDLSLMTGESRPVDAGVGDAVVAGSVNLGAPLRVRVEAAGRATRLGRLMALVEESSRDKAPIVRLADRVSAWFVAAVVALAGVTFAAWWTVDAAAAVEHTVSLLIITCPCALGLATPLAVVVSIGRAARRGILVRGGAALEALAGRGTVIFDKTGTLTTGRMRVVSYDGPEELKGLIASAERGSTHPAARAIREAFAGSDGDVEPRAEVEHALGGGVRATVGGRELTIGSARFVRGAIGDGPLPGRVEAALARAAEAGCSPVVVACDGVACGVIALGDSVRPEAARCVRALRDWGWNAVVLSGDDPRIARGVARALGIAEESVIGGASPEDKVAFVKAWAGEGPTIMVGDGVNDAAALSAATVGVAVEGGTEAALTASDVSLARAGLSPLVELMDGARRTTAVIRRNLAVSLAYNVLFGGLAVAGLVSPLVAAVLMPLSGISVVVLSHRTGAFAAPGASQGAGS
ncbi:MAG: heavy metal translocating P-type ATPase [Planctomycetota bacterium]|nr:heavy metal translocating P-type ATPase [Planctomycetota bacterium]